MTELKDILTTQHPEYQENFYLWRLLDDCRTGKGGFACSLETPEMTVKGPKYTNTQEYSYILPYPTEKQKFFSARIRNSVYVNHFRRIQDVILGFIKRSPISISNLPPELEKWSQNCDGQGHSLEQFIQSAVAEDMLTYGFSLIKTDKNNVRQNNKATDAEPYCVVVDPRIQIAWSLNEYTGQLEWTRWQENFVRWDNPLSGPINVTRWTLWTPDSITTWETDGKEIDMVADLSKDNEIGELPITVAYYTGVEATYHIPSPPLQSAAMMSVWLYNRSSEEIELYRKRGFPQLIWPVMGNNMPKELVIGLNTIIPFPAETQMQPFYIQPNGDTASNYAELIKRGEAQLYEQTRTDFSRSGTQVESGISRAIRFQSMNSTLVSFATALASCAKDLCIKALKYKDLNINAEEILKDTVFETPTNFDVEDLDRELVQYSTALEAQLGPTAEAEIKKALRDKVVTLKEKQLKKSNKELDYEAAVKTQSETADEEIPNSDEQIDLEEVETE